MCECRTFTREIFRTPTRIWRIAEINGRTNALSPARCMHGSTVYRNLQRMLYATLTGSATLRCLTIGRPPQASSLRPSTLGTRCNETEFTAGHFRLALASEVCWTRPVYDDVHVQYLACETGARCVVRVVTLFYTRLLKELIISASEWLSWVAWPHTAVCVG